MALSEIKDGVTVREHYLKHWKMLNYDPAEMPAQLKEVECADEVMYLWDYFESMNLRRTSNGFGLNPVTEEALQGWQKRWKITLEPFEWLIIDALETLYLSEKAKQVKK